ncbi:hypothetical protein AB0K38_32560 [Streptomyces griseoincarnatus]
MTDAAIDRFAVRWRLPAPELREDATALLDALLEDVLDEAMAGLVAADEQVAIASVRVPPMHVHAGRTGETASAWARQVASAVAEQLVTGGPSVVRYPNRPAALLDLTVRACAGDTSLVWAWRRLGLWPTAATAENGATGTVADAVTAALAAEVTAVAPVLAAVGRRGVLPQVVALLGPERLERLAAAAWQALGGAPEEVHAAGARDVPRDAADPDAAAGERLVDRPTPPAPGAALPGGLGYATALLLGSPLGTAASAAHGARVRAALTALALVDTDPGRVASDGAAVLGLALREPAAREQAVPEPDPRAKPPAGTTADIPTAPPREAGSLPVHATGSAARTYPTMAVPGATANAGLLFYLHLVAPFMCRNGAPPSCAPLFELKGLGTRGAMYVLGAELLRRSAPKLRAPEPADPALLAFCGLSPSAEPPDPLGDADHGAVRRESARLVDRTVRELRHRLAGRPPAQLPQTTLIAHLLHRRGEITASPGWLEVRLDLDDVSVDLRAAGLDLDPGWLPALGCIVRFRYA